MTAVPNSSLGRVLVLAPQGRDAGIARALLKEAGIISEICLDLPALERALGDDTCFAVVTEEALRSADLRILGSRVNAQPTWSDLPFIILTQLRGERERNRTQDCPTCSATSRSLSGHSTRRRSSASRGRPSRDAKGSMRRADESSCYMKVKSGCARRFWPAVSVHGSWI